MSILKRLILAAGLMFFGFMPAQAQRNLTIGAQSAPSGMDPHYHSSNPNNAILRQIFETLVDFDTSGRLVPRLAESWRAIDDLTWEFKLRDGVRFHDGTPFSVEDIAFSYARVPTIANSPGPFTPFVRSIAAIEIPEPRRVLIRTKEPNPFLDWDLSTIMILSRTLHANATLGDFNLGRAMIGTGAYRHVSYTQGERHEITRNPNYWG
ncbi:MAG: ABC transporter substrate-binding protein, partial [Alphaproteobacteria bacterium]